VDLQTSFTAAKSTKFPTKPILGYHHILSVLLNYLGKLKTQKFCIHMHVKHVSNVTFYHLSNRCLPNAMKINAKISTMQNTNILLFAFFHVNHLDFGGHNHIPWTADRLRRYQHSSPVSVINFWRSAAMLITSTVEICIQQLGRVEEMVLTRDAAMLARSWES